MQITILYQISERHCRVWYKDDEYDMQVLNIDKIKYPTSIVKRVLIEYNYNNVNHMLVELE